LENRSLKAAGSLAVGYQFNSFLPLSGQEVDDVVAAP
jgi:hypothetical protein